VDRFISLVLLLVFPRPVSQRGSLLICWRSTASTLRICDQTAFRALCLSARAELRLPPEVATVRQRLELSVFSPMSSRAPNNPIAPPNAGCAFCLRSGPQWPGASEFLRWAAEHEMSQIHTEANEGNEVGSLSSFPSFATVALPDRKIVSNTLPDKASISV
jgi:hypothetical protein